MKMTGRSLLRILGFSVLFFGVILFLTWAAIQVSPLANAVTVGFAFLIVVLMAAIFAGQAVAIVTSILATLCFDFFFLPPYGTFRIADPDNWVALLSFLIVTMTVGHYISAAAESETKRKELEKGDLNLSKFVPRLFSIAPGELTLSMLAEETKRIFELDSCSIHLHESGQSEYRSGSSEAHGKSESGQDVNTTFDRLADETGQDVRYFAIDAGGGRNGVLIAKTAHVPAETLKTAASLISIVLKEYGEKHINIR